MFNDIDKKAKKFLEEQIKPQFFKKNTGSSANLNVISEADELEDNDSNDGGNQKQVVI